MLVSHCLHAPSRARRSCMHQRKKVQLFLKRFRMVLLLRASLLPAFASWLSGQPEPHHAGHFLWVPLSFAVIEVVQDHVVPGRCQQTQVGLRVVVGLLLSAAVPFPRHLLEKRLKLKVSNISPLSSQNLHFTTRFLNNISCFFFA